MHQIHFELVNAGSITRARGSILYVDNLCSLFKVHRQKRRKIRTVIRNMQSHQNKRVLAPLRVFPDQDGAVLADTDQVLLVGAHPDPGDIAAVSFAHVGHGAVVVIPDLEEKISAGEGIEKCRVLGQFHSD